MQKKLCKRGYVESHANLGGGGVSSGVGMLRDLNSWTQGWGKKRKAV